LVRKLLMKIKLRKLLMKRKLRKLLITRELMRDGEAAGDEKAEEAADDEGTAHDEKGAGD